MNTEVSQDLIPADPKRCQVMIPNGNTFMTFGGKPGHVRCSRIPIVIVREAKPGEDGLVGEMSMCSHCLTRYSETFPAGHGIVRGIE